MVLELPAEPVTGSNSTQAVVQKEPSTSTGSCKGTLSRALTPQQMRTLDFMGINPDPIDEVHYSQNDCLQQQEQQQEPTNNSTTAPLAGAGANAN